MKISYDIIPSGKVLHLYKQYLAGIPSYYPAQDVLDSLNVLPDYFIVGVIQDNRVLGFLDGHRLTPKVHRLLNVYKGYASAQQILRLQRRYEELIVEKGYVGWYSEAMSHTKGIMEKLGAVQWE